MADKKKKLKLSIIEIDPDIQPRAKGLHEPTVEEYREAVEGGDEFPPLVVYVEGKTHRLSEGFHRAEAYKRAGVKEVECIVRVGSRRDAILNACGSNSAHGLPRTNADKRSAVLRVLKECPSWSNPRIAKVAAVSAEFVRSIRPAEEGETREGANGKAQPATKTTPQVASVATCPVEIPKENADSLPEITSEPEPEESEAEALEAAVDHLEECVLRDEANGFKPVLHQPEPESAPVDEGAEFIATVETLCRDTDQIAARMKTLKPSRFSYSIHIDSAVSQIEAARKTLWQGRPAHVCPYCKGEPDGCKPCNNTGRVKKTVFDSGTKAIGEAA